MSKHYNYLGFIKLNNEEDGLNYLPGDNESIEISSLMNRHRCIDEEGDIFCTKYDTQSLKSKHGDLTGRQFGKLKVLHLNIERTIENHRPCWVCQCKCGKIKTILEYNLIAGKSTSCGCGHSRNVYDLDSADYGIGYTANGTKFLFDKEDYPLIKQYSWHTDIEGYIIAKYNNSQGKGIIKMHRLIMGVTDPSIPIDHIHHNKADNRKSELRIVTQRENAYNRKLSKSNKSGHTGLYYSKIRNGWRTYITVDGKTIHLGYFPTKEEAIKIRNEAEEKYFGEYRCQD